MGIAKIFVFFFLLITIIFGIKSFKNSNKFFKSLLIQTILYAILTIGVIGMKYYFSQLDIQFSNIIYVNMFVGVEAIILFVAALYILVNRTERIISIALGTLFVFAFIFQLLYFGPNASNDLADVIACISLTAVYALVLNRVIRLNKKEWWKSPEILTTIGMLLYFAGSVPFVAMSNYLAKNATDLYVLLFYIINDGLANVRYLLLALSFILIYRARGKNQLQF